MPRKLSVSAECFPLRQAFTISRGSKTEAEVVTCRIEEGGARGWGESVPYKRYGESVDAVTAAIEGVRGAIEGGASRDELLDLLPRGAARNAVDCALWDLEAKRSGRRVAASVLSDAPSPLETAFTLSLGEADEMGREAATNATRPLLKIKLGRPGDIERMRAVVEAAPRSRIIVDANEGWGIEVLEENLEAAAALGIALVEQPLPAGHDAALGQIAHPVSICADESVHGLEDLIKLDKTGGLTAALLLKREAERLGFSVMVGCMVGTSLAMAPAVLLAQGAAFTDLDGPLLLAKDREVPLRYEGSLVYPPEAALWG